MTDLIDYYRRGGPCIDYNDECRYRSSGCPCTETADALEAQQAVIAKLEAKLKHLREEYNERHEWGVKQATIVIKRKQAALTECLRLADESVSDLDEDQHKWLSAIAKTASTALDESK